MVRGPAYHVFRLAAAAAGPRLLHSSASAPALAQALHDYATDLRVPASWYPVARGLQRRVVAHLGPTNSGKTHHALSALQAAGTGVYCAPLRLLAWEVAERLNGGGTPCNLVTGQERTERPDAQHTACTVEMAGVGRPLDVAVVDEIQLMADPNRGWAFTRALLGLPAKEVHVTGDPAALPLLQELCRQAGDHLEVAWYERLAPLRVASRELGAPAAAGRGDCLVAFSRREVHALRRAVEAAGAHRCCVVYGALPPEARSQQAMLFNTPRSGYNVLAASDAVGLGLNLAIKRITFTSLQKFDGTSQRALTAAEIKQIAGRAGRFCSSYAAAGGIVSALDAADLPHLRAALAQPSELLRAACLLPQYEQLEVLAAQHPQEGLAPVLSRFVDAAVLGPRYELASVEDMARLAVMLKHLEGGEGGLTLREAYTFAISPTDPADAPVAAALLAMATAYSLRGGVSPAALLAVPVPPAVAGEAELQGLEAQYRVLDLFLWLAFRFPEAFGGAEAVQERRAACAAAIDASIRALGVPRRSRKARGQAGPAPDCGGRGGVVLSSGLRAEEERQEEEQRRRRQRRRAWG